MPVKVILLSGYSSHIPPFLYRKCESFEDFNGLHLRDFMIKFLSLITHPNINNHVPFLISAFHIAVSLGSLFQRIAFIDDRL